MGLEDFFIDVKDLPEGMYGSCQLLFLGLVYAYILMVASNLVSDGSELLLLVPSLAGIVGSVVLPVLGAVPDGAIVLFSGLGDKEVVQEELNIGIGALAGSTIMVLTLPWALCILGGAVPCDKDGKVDYKLRKKNVQGGLSSFGIGLTKNIQFGSYILLFTSVGYLFLQGPAIMAMGYSTDVVAKYENAWAGIGLLISASLFCSYLYYQYKSSLSGQDQVLKEKKFAIIRQAIANGSCSFRGLLFEAFYASPMVMRDESTPLVPEALEDLKSIIKPLFTKYDTDKNGSLDVYELGALIQDLRICTVTSSNSVSHQIFERFDQDGNGQISLAELSLGLMQYFKSISEPEDDDEVSITKQYISTEMNKQTPDQDEDDDEEEDMPEDLIDLSPEQQQFNIKMRSAWMLSLGTFLVVLFSDPMVDVLNEAGKRTGIPAFYVSFVFAPMAANLTEVIAAYNYSKKRTQKTIEISISALQGACAMNNTFVLGIFMILIYFRQLAWQYMAETASILLVEILIVFMTQKSQQTLLDALIILSVYPLSLIFVAVLESMGFD
jgi:Ca2+/Na+ antiporter